jgi:drug/metabolite transporter (DMT)-like permease
VCLLWGTTYLAIRIALDSIPPLLMSAFRWIIAGTVIIAVLKIRGERLPERRAWPSLFVLGILFMGFGNGGVVWAEQTVPSGLTALLVATLPFWMVGLDALMADGDRLTLRRASGLVVGFCGIVLLVWPKVRIGHGGGAFLGGVIAAQIACLGWAIGSTYARRRGQGENVLAAAALEMVFGGVCLLVAGLLANEWTRLRFTPRATGAFAYLLLFGSIVGFSAYTYALKHLPVATVSLYAYINPVIAVVLGTVVLGEPFNWRMGVAAAVVFLGIVLVRDTTA